MDSGIEFSLLELRISLLALQLSLIRWELAQDVQGCTVTGN